MVLAGLRNIIPVTRGDSGLLAWRFGTAYTGASQISGTPTLKFVAKVEGDFAGEAVVSNWNGSAWTYTLTGTGSSAVYTIPPGWNTTKLHNLLGYDPAGFAEVTHLRTHAAPLPTGSHFILSDSAGTVGVWIDEDNAGTTIPDEAAACDRAIEITTLVTGDTAAQRATKIAAVLEADAEFTASSSGNLITLTDRATGSRTAAADGDTGFTIARWIEGAAPGSMTKRAFVDLDAQLEVTTSTETYSTLPFTVRVYFDVTQGSENAPATAGVGTLTLPAGCTVTFAGAYAATFTLTAATTLTLPTTGTLATTADVSAVLPSQTGNNGGILITNGTSASWTLGVSGLTLSDPTILGGSAESLTSLGLSSGNSNQLKIAAETTLTADCTLYIELNDTDRIIRLGGNVFLSGSLSLSGNFTTTGGHAVALTTTSSTNLTLPTSGTLATEGGVAAAYQPLDADLTAIAALSGTDTLYYRSAANTWTAVTVASALSFTGGTLTIAALGVTNAMLAGSIDLTAKVTGVLPAANGGTGITGHGHHARVKTPGTASNMTCTSGGTYTLISNLTSETADANGLWNSGTSKSGTLPAGGYMFTLCLAADNADWRLTVFDDGSAVAVHARVDSNLPGWAGFIVADGSSVYDFRVQQYSGGDKFIYDDPAQVGLVLVRIW